MLATGLQEDQFYPSVEGLMNQFGLGTHILNKPLAVPSAGVKIGPVILKCSGCGAFNDANPGEQAEPVQTEGSGQRGRRTGREAQAGIMQRDMELIRKIMFKAEADLDLSDLTSDGYTLQQISYHVWLLGQAGWMAVETITAMGDPWPQAVPVSLTWHGHDFIDSARNDTVWSRAIHKARSLGISLAPTILKELLDSIIKGDLHLR